MLDSVELIAEFFNTPVVSVPVFYNIFGVTSTTWIPSDLIENLLGLPADITVGQLLIGLGLISILSLKLGKLLINLVLRLA